MSIAWMTKVWRYSKHSGSALLLMLAIADCANEEGEAWPGRAFLAVRIRKTESYTRELIERLIKSRELRQTHSGGHGQGDTHRYRITIKGRQASPSILEENQGEAGLPNKGRFRGGLGEVTTLKNRADPIEPLTINNIYTSTTTSKQVVVVMDEWDLVQLLKLGRVTKSRMAEIAAMDPTPSAAAYVAHYLYGMTIHKINVPAHFAAKRIVEQLEAGEPFETLAGQGPKWLTECLHWIFTGVENFDGLTPQALALKNYLPMEIASRLIPRAFDELGLASYLPKPEEPEPVGEFEPRERPVPDEWQQALERVRVHYPPATMDGLQMCKLVGRENGTMLVEVPGRHMLQWLEHQKVAAGLNDYGVFVAFQLRETNANAS